MAKNNVRLPQSTAGITSFSDTDNSKFHITPPQVIGFIIFVIVLVVLLKFFGPGLLGM